MIPNAGNKLFLTNPMLSCHLMKCLPNVNILILLYTIQPLRICLCNTCREFNINNTVRIPGMESYYSNFKHKPPRVTGFMGE